jgi:hypothetical protein
VGNYFGKISFENNDPDEDPFFFWIKGVVTARPPSIPGDYNKDGKVDFEDYEVWRSSYGSVSNLDADGNKNGTIDLADYVLWRENLGRTSTSSSSAPAGAHSSRPAFAPPKRQAFVAEPSIDAMVDGLAQLDMNLAAFELEEEPAVDAATLQPRPFRLAELMDGSFVSIRGSRSTARPMRRPSFPVDHALDNQLLSLLRAPTSPPVGSEVEAFDADHNRRWDESIEAADAAIALLDKEEAAAWNIFTF